MSLYAICNHFILCCPLYFDPRKQQAKTRMEMCRMKNLFPNRPIMNPASIQAATFRKLKLGVSGPLEKELPPLCLLKKPC